MTELQVEIWSDIVCPWCYLGKRHFENALASFEHRESVSVRWRSFELQPDAPRDAEPTIPERMRDLGLSDREAQDGIDRLTAMAAAAGLTYHLESARPVNSFDVHRLMHLADDHDLGDAVRERFMSAYTGEGAYLGDHETLLRLTTEAGLDERAAAAVLESDAHADAVRADEARGRALGVTGVPFFVFGERYGVAGAQPAEVFGDLLTELISPVRPG